MESLRPPKDPSHLWATCADIIRPQVSEAVWHTTFHALRPLVLDDDVFTIAAPSLLVKERIEGRYLGLLRDALADAQMADLDLEILVDDQRAVIDPDTTIDLRGAHAVVIPGNAAVAATADGSGEETARSADTPVARYTFDAFVTGTSNRFAHAAALSVAETPARSYNPLFIYGAAGLGKTHLLQAIHHYVNSHYPTYTVRYVSTETLMNQFVDAIRNNTMSNFKHHYREIDVLLVDDIQFMEGKEGLQEEFFHTFNSLHQANRQIVLSSDRPPDSIATLEDRLRSRFKMGLITDIQPPDLETRIAILRKKAERDPFGMNEDVLSFIAENITDNIRELEGALIRVTAYSSLTREPLSAEMARQVLGDILTNQQPRMVTPQLILDRTATQFGYTIDEIIGQSRRRPLVTARQIAMYVFRELTDLSYPAIAREFGGRDHTTVIHAVEKIGGLMRERRQIYEQVTELIQSIKSPG